MHILKLASLAVGIGQLAAPALAQAPIQLAHNIFVEQVQKPGAGPMRLLEPAKNLISGDRIVLVLNWQTPKNRESFTVISAVPKTVSFQRSSDGTEEISVDHARNWGKLGLLTIRDGGQIRLATPEDATHLRWHIAPPRTTHGHGAITYSAIVR